MFLVTHKLSLKGNERGLQIKNLQSRIAFYYNWQVVYLNCENQMFFTGRGVPHFH